MLILPDGSIADKTPSTFAWPLFRMAFRPLFLFGSGFSILALVAWIAYLSGSISLRLYGGGLWWHSHEMLFGFGTAIITGFLLTAVQTWTKQPSISGWLLILLVSSWIVPRFLLIFPANLPGWLIALTDLIYLPLAGSIMIRLIVRVKQWRNLFFGPLLLILAGLNAMMHWIALSATYEYLPVITNTAVLLVALLMCVMGGRVFPMFTANGTGTEKIPAIRWLELSAISSMLFAVLVTLAGDAISAQLSAPVYFAAAAFNAMRCLRWRIWVTLKAPLVWSLHLSYWCLVLGMFGLGVARLSGSGWSEALHIITIGAMGGMMLAMISRVSLGHTGRMIQSSSVMAVAFISINLSMLVRVLGSSIFSEYQTVLWLAAGLWILSYGCFLIYYARILVRPRTDGGPG